MEKTPVSDDFVSLEKKLPYTIRFSQSGGSSGVMEILLRFLFHLRETVNLRVSSRGITVFSTKELIVMVFSAFDITFDENKNKRQHTVLKRMLFLHGLRYVRQIRNIFF